MLFNYTAGGKTEEYRVGNFVSKLARYGRGVGALGQAMYYFVPSGKYGGGGTLTPAMAADAVLYIKKTMLEGGNSPRYKGPPMKQLGDRYANWKSKVSSFRGRPLMVLTGTMAAAVGAKRSAGGKMVVTLDDKMVGPPASPDRPGVKVGDYWHIHELGTGGNKGLVPQRPIVTGAMAGWIAMRSYSWKVAFQKLMRQTVWGSMQDDKMELAEDIVPSSSTSDSIDILSNLARQADVVESLAKNVSKVARNLLVATARGAKGHQYSGNQRAAVQELLRRELSGSGYSPDEVNTIIDIALSGQIPNKYIFD